MSKDYFLFSLIPQRIISFRCEDIFDRLIYQVHLSDFISLKYLTIYIDNIRSSLSSINRWINILKSSYINIIIL